MIDWKTLGFDAYRTRTVVVSHFKDGAWSPAQTTETFSFTLDPFAQVLHYAMSCFEGFKTFRQKDGRVAMFRPDQNAARLVRSAKYLGLPCPPEELFIQMSELCVKNNLEFLPPYGYGASMYIRPLLCSDVRTGGLLLRRLSQVLRRRDPGRPRPGRSQGLRQLQAQQQLRHDLRAVPDRAQPGLHRVALPELLHAGVCR